MIAKHPVDQPGWAGEPRILVNEVSKLAKHLVSREEVPDLSAEPRGPSTPPPRPPDEVGVSETSPDSLRSFASLGL